MISVRLGAQVVAPFVYLTTAAALASILAYVITLSPVHGASFSLMVTRGAQVVLLVSLVPLARALKLTAAELGFPVGWGALLKQLAAGFGLGTLILSIHVALLLQLGAIKPNPAVVFSVSELVTMLRRVIWVGFLVATMEELIFRGVGLAALCRIGATWSAAGITALYYALLHFVRSDFRPSGAEIEWWSGFAILADGVRRLLHDTPFDCLLALFCVGLFLAAVRLIVPRALALCIGIHAGWVVVIKVARRLTDPDPHAPLAYLVGPYDQIIGYAAAGWISLLLMLILAAARLRDRRFGRRT